MTNYHVNVEKVKYKSDGGSGQIRTVSKLAGGTYTSKLIPKDFINDLRCKLLSFVNDLEIKYYSVDNDCIVDIGVFKEDNCKKNTPKIMRYLNATYDKLGKLADIRKTFCPELVDIIIEDADNDIDEKISKVLQDNNITDYKTKTVYQTWDSTTERESFCDFVVSMPGNLAVIAIPLIKELIIKESSTSRIVITNEKLRSQLSKLVGHSVHLSSYAWGSQRCEHIVGKELMNTTFVSDSHKINVYYDNDMNVISHHIKDKSSDDTYSHSFLKSKLK